MENNLFPANLIVCPPRIFRIKCPSRKNDLRGLLRFMRLIARPKHVFSQRLPLPRDSLFHHNGWGLFVIVSLRSYNVAAVAVSGVNQ